MTKRILSMILVLFGTLTAMGQITTSSLTGSARTVAGQGLSGASIRAVHQPSGTVYAAVSRADGAFVINNMRVGGPYRIEVTYVGYQPQTFDDITLRLGEPYNLDVKMTEGSKSLTEVVVSSAASRNAVLNASRTGTTTNINARAFSNLPTIQRSLNDFTRLTPQATSTNTGAIGGGNSRQNFITVDGSDFNNTFGIGGNLPANGSPISLDAIQELSINVTPYDVRQSNFIGSAMNAVTRSGTNQFSGSLYTYWRNQNQIGSDAGPDKVTIQPSDFKQYGGRLGGPIIRNKLFFFVNYETEKTITPGQNQVAATPSAPYGTANPNVSKPTASELDAIRDYLMKNYNYDPGIYQGYSNEAPRKKLLARIDWNISDKHKFNIRYSQTEGKSPSFVSTSRSPLTAYSLNRTASQALWFKNSNYFQDANFYSWAAELNSNLGRVANTLRFTLTHQNDPRSSESTVFPFVDILDGSALTGVGTPFTSFGYEPFTYGNLRDVSTTSVIDYVTWTSKNGRNNWTVGGQFDVSTTKNGFQRFGTSYYTFRSWNDFVTGVKPVDYAITYSLTPGYEQAFPKYKFGQASLYAQDEMKASDKLRLSFGLRADLPMYLNVPEIKTHPLVEPLVFQNNEHINTGVLPKTRLLLSPRIGFNWDVRGDRSLQVRGGTGIFAGRVPTVWIVAQSGDAGLIQFTQVYETPTANRNNPALYVTPGPFNPDPRAYLPATPPAAGTAIPSTISAISPDFKAPQTWKANLAVDFKMPWGMVGTVEGIYNNDFVIAKGRNPNFVTPQALNVSGYPDNRPVYPATSSKFLYALTAAGQTGGTNAFNPVVLDNAKGGYYWSLTGRIEKNFSSGWFASVSYTKSMAKNTFDGSGDQLLNTWSLTQIVNDNNNPELSYANYVVPDRILATVSYRKEYLRHLGTTLSLVFEGSIGGRFSYTYGGDFNRDGQTNDLIYIPRDASEITFTDFTYNGVLYTAKQQSDIFFRYIEQDKYLSAHKGEYAERNGATLPWRNQVDVKIVQDLFVNVGGKRNTIQFTLDIMNFGNLLNKNWGLFKTINASTILVPTNATGTGTLFSPGGTVKPTFRLQTDRNQPVTSTFRNTVSVSSTYYMQMGLRYIF
ncbi:MAG: carboxypeptidase regulatory-like domain-containing protein [Chitinophagaceae bacterium]|nr:carboxypeptidase regulatory-like domain-containing protein [Chitinophagaceae bacterium]